MTSEKSLPAWSQAVRFAHEACALVEEGVVPEPRSAERLRRAALSVPSLVSEAFLDHESTDAVTILSHATARLREVRELLSAEPLVRAMPGLEREALLEQIDHLIGELVRLAADRSGTPANG